MARVIAASVEQALGPAPTDPEVAVVQILKVRRTAEIVTTSPVSPEALDAADQALLERIWGHWPRLPMPRSDWDALARQVDQSAERPATWKPTILLRSAKQERWVARKQTSHAHRATLQRLCDANERSVHRSGGADPMPGQPVPDDALLTPGGLSVFFKALGLTPPDASP
ncbi:MAG: hypothetical protein J0M20_02300 [Burkholderiales bacterium]|nr:hypothetical protein [Burkholderiales bacterium]